MGQSVSCLNSEGPLLLTAASDGDASQVRHVGQQATCTRSNESGCGLQQPRRLFLAGPLAEPQSCRVYTPVPSAQLPALCGRYGDLDNTLSGLRNVLVGTPFGFRISKQLCLSISLLFSCRPAACGHTNVLQEVLLILKPAGDADKLTRAQVQLHRKVLNQRSSKGQTPLSVACSTG